MYAPDDQYLAIQLHFTLGFRVKKPFTGRYFTRFQRAPEGSGQSTGRRSDNIVQGCGMLLN